MTRIPPVSRGSLLEPAGAKTGFDPVPLWRSLAILGLGALVWMAHLASPTPMIPPQSGVVMHLPGFVNIGSGFVGENAEITTAERTILPKDTEFARKNYRDFPRHDNILLSIVLSGAEQQSIHRPEACLPAQGWSIANQEDIPIKLDSGHELTVRNLTIKRTITFNGQSATRTDYNMYWFVGENVTTPSQFMRVFLSSWDRIVHNRAHRWAYVTVESPITRNFYPQGLDAQQTKDLLIQFIRYVVPQFQKNEMPARGNF
jgi:hypothetical protein